MLRRATTSSIAAAGAAKPASSSLMLRRTLTTSPLIRGPWSGSVSSSSSQLKHYVIFAEDVEEGGEGLRRRLQVRPEHLAGAREGKESGRIELGGGLLGVDHSEVGEDGPARHLKGSLFVVLGESIADVRSRLEQDVYYSSGVFDPAKVRIFPFLKASLGDSPAAAAASASGNADQTTTTTTTTTTKTTITPSLSKLREEEMSRWAEKAAKSLQWLREGGGKQGLA